MKVAYKVWLDNDGKAFGEGPYELLKHVEKTGSLHQAAIQMGMSYRKAWLTIRASEKRLGFPLLERTVGGLSGGGSQLTPSGRRFMKKYERFRNEVAQAIEQTYQNHFTQLPKIPRPGPRRRQRQQPADPGVSLQASERHQASRQGTRKG